MDGSTKEQTGVKPKGFAGKGRIDLLNGDTTSSLIKFAIPMTFSFLVNMVYSWIDTYFVSRLGKDAIAAIGVSEQLGFFVFTFGSGIAMGTGIIVARRIGEGDRKLADYTATQAVLFMVALSLLVFTPVVYLLIPYLIPKFNLESNVATLAGYYLSALFMGITGNFVMFQLNAIVRSTGNSVFPMIILLSTTVLNAILAPIFIFGLGPIPSMGIFGAGLATASAQIFGALVSVYSVLSGKAGIRFRFKGIQIDWSIIKRIVTLGLPASLQMFIVSATRITIFKLAAAFGTSVVAAYTIGLKVDFILFMIVFSIGIAIETATGQNLGAGKPERVMQFHKSGMKIIGTMSLILGAAMYLGGFLLAKAFTDDATIISNTEKYLHISVFGYFLFATGIISTRVISGAGAAIRSLLIVGGSVLLIQLPLAWGVSTYLGKETGIWIGAVLGYLFFAAIALYNVYSKKWMTVKV